MKGAAWDGMGAPQLESAKKATALISEVRTHVWNRQMIRPSKK